LIGSKTDSFSNLEVFPVHGAMPDAMPRIWENVFSEWFSSTGYEHTGGPEMEVYISDADSSSEDYYSER